MTLHKHPIHTFMILVEVSQLVMTLLLLFILVILSFVRLGLSLGLLPLLFVLLILHLLLGILGDGPQVLSGLLGGFGIISDHEVVKNGSRLDLPQVKAELAHLIVLADGLSLVLIVLRVVNLRVDPGSLVLGVIDHGRLPLSVHLIVPVLPM